MPLYYANQFFSTTLNVGGGIDASQTTGITLQSVSGLDITKPGIACISYADPLVTSTAEWVTFTSINGSNVLQGVTRGAEGFGAKTHSNGAVIVFPLSKSHINNINDLLTEITADLAVGKATAQTLTNKRIEPRIVSAASYTTDTGTSLSVATADIFQVTAQAGALKFNNPGGTPVAGQKLIIRIKDDGTARALTYDTYFRAMGVALPSTTVLSKTLYMGFIYNVTDTKWDLVASAQEA